MWRRWVSSIVYSVKMEWHFGSLPKESAKLLGSSLKETNYWQLEHQSTCTEIEKMKLDPIFPRKWLKCTTVNNTGLIIKFGIDYKADNWKICRFI